MGISLILRSFSVLCATLPAVALMAQGVPADYKTYRKALLDQGYSPLTPASTEFSPGYVYRLRRTSDGRDVVETVCKRLFTDMPQEHEEKPIGGSKVRDGSLKLSITLLPAFLAKIVSTVFGGDTSANKSTDVTFNGTRVAELPIKFDTNSKTGEVVERKVDKACTASLQALPSDSKGRFVNKVFVVIRSMSADSFTFTLDAAHKSTVSLTAKADNIGDASAGWTSSSTNKQSFKLEKNAASPKVYIAADIVQITTVSDIKDVGSTALANIGIAPVTDADRAALSTHDL